MSSPRKSNPFKLFEGENSEIEARNAANKKIKWGVVADESHYTFKEGWDMLQAVPFDSQEADIIIAGMSILSMTSNDWKYPEDSSLYPQKTIKEVFDICCNDLPTSLSDQERLQAMIKSIGHHALIEKDLGFDGKVCRYGNHEFNFSDWSAWTDRFDKYNLTDRPQPT